jgi:DNA-binding MarR family transcriptional regulator
MKIEEEIHSRFRNERHKAGVNLIYTSNWYTVQISDLVKEQQLTLPQYNILRILRGIHPQPVSVKYIRERMLDKMSDVSRIVEKMREKGLVSRWECNEDRRTVNIVISEEGLRVLALLDPNFEFGEEIFTRLTEEEVTLLNHLLDKLRTDPAAQSHPLA